MGRSHSHDRWIQEETETPSCPNRKEDDCNTPTVAGSGPATEVSKLDDPWWGGFRGAWDICKRKKKIGLRDSYGSLQVRKFNSTEVDIYSIYKWILKSGEGCKVGQYYCPDGEGIASLEAVTSQGFQGVNQLNPWVAETLTGHQRHRGGFRKWQAPELPSTPSEAASLRGGPRNQ